MKITELVFIIDKSGSMSGLENETIKGFNELLNKQKKQKDKALITTIFFNTTMQFINERKDINEVKEITLNDYRVGGCTALLDAIGNAINYIYNNQINDKENEYNNMVVIITDGLENSSLEFSYEKINSLINKKQKEDWQFIFLGANIDVIKEANKMGIASDNAVSYNNDEKGVKLNYEAISLAISDVRSNKKLSKKWRSEIDDDYKKRNI
ncbi:MAG: vWA domain-containing protein [Candidatus Caccosoma sp.]|nr:vWA domain-containing protein [Candidatus Caccosoma sp.]